MFGLFKKKISKKEFGFGLLELTSESVSNDCIRLAVTYQHPEFDFVTDDVDEVLDDEIGSQNFSAFLKVYKHLIFQSAFHNCKVEGARELLSDTMDMQQNGGQDYDFTKLYEELDANYTVTSDSIGALFPSVEKTKIENMNRYSLINTKFLLSGPLDFGDTKVSKKERTDKFLDCYVNSNLSFNTTCKALEHLSGRFTY